MSRNSRYIVLGAAVIVAVFVGGFSLFGSRPEPSQIVANDTKPTGSGPVAPAGGGTGTAGSEPADAAPDGGFLARVEAAMRIRDAAERQTVLAGILAEWLTADAAGVGKYIMMLEVKNDRSKLAMLTGALNAALASLDESLLQTEEVKEPVRRFTVELARSDPDAALALAEAWLTGDTRDSTFVQIARSLAARDPQAALALRQRMSQPLRLMQVNVVVGSVWAQSDPEAALAWATSIAQPTDRAMTLNALLLSVAQTDPESAAARLSVNERTMADEWRRQYLADLASMNLTEAELANDPDTYRELLEGGNIPPRTSSDVELLGDAARVTASKLAAEDPAGGIAWAESIEDDRLRLHAVKGAVAGWSRTQPDAAAEYVATHYPRLTEMLAAVYEVWTEDAPAQAAAGTRLLGDATLRAAATRTVVEAWAVTDAAAAASWVDQLPDADRTDAVQLALVSALSDSRPVDAWTRAQTIKDPTLQYRGLRAAFSVLVTEKPEAARQLLASTSLAPKDAERLQEMLATVDEG